MKRLQKVIAHAGITSRESRRIYPCRTCKSKRTSCKRELGIKVGKHDTVEVDEVPIYQEEYGYYLLYNLKESFLL